MRTRSAASVLLLALAVLLAAACGETDESGGSSDDSIPLTDDSLGPPLEPSTAGDATDTSEPTGSTTSAAEGGGGPQASAELCEQLLSTAQPTPEQVELFPEDLQDDAAEYVEQIQQYIEDSEEAAANGGSEEGGLPDEVPQMSAELAAYLSTCQ
jgi:hypothetical protein